MTATDMANQTTGELATMALTKDEIEEARTFAEVQAEATALGLSEESTTLVINNYQTLNQDKDPLVDRPFWIRAVKFMHDTENDSDYVQFWAIRDDDALYRVTDGSTGIYAQLIRAVQKRTDEKHPTPFNYYRVANGLTKSEFWVNNDESSPDFGKAIKDPEYKGKKREAATYYLA